MNRITLSQAQRITEAALEKGRSLALKPLGVAVVDPGGHLIAFAREDGASLLRPQMATGKASSALALGMSSRKIGEMAADRPSLVASLGPVAPAGMIPAAGGVIVVDANGDPIGAVGISGDTSDNDETCAIAGIEAAGLTPQS